MTVSNPHADETTAEPPARAGGREWAGLILLALPMAALSTDLTVLFFALPTLSADLDPTPTQLLWITHVYGFLIAGFLVTAGRLGDRVGPRRLLLIGSAAFGVLSVVAAFSTSATMLIAARAALGIAGATLMPSLFSLLRTMFRDDRQRRLAIAVMFSTFTVGGAVGPVLGGALLEVFWWGSVFLINVPPIVLLLLGGTTLLPERTERNRDPIDLLSVALSVSGLLAIVYGLQELAAGPETGGVPWSALLSVGAGVGIMVLFVRRQRRIASPLFDMALLANRRMAASLTTLLMMGISVTGVFYLFTQYLQWVGGLSPLQAGLWTLPYIVLNIVGAMTAPGLAERLRPAVVAGTGVFIAAVGACCLVLTAGSDVSLVLSVASISIVGLGQGVAGALLSDLIVSSAAVEKTGSAVSAQEVGGEAGAALGIAAGGMVAILAYRHGLSDLPAAVPESAAEAARAGVHEGVAVAENLPAGGPQLLGAVHQAVGLGLQAYAGLACIILIATGAFLLAVLGRRRTPS
ncbi:DHA2 family multidrug resistance protein-like MFS transporter [Actinoalloteichus hoggarensis]|uniref:Antiseptic resistance protein n=1 Tax=Actinoalloteichus hoggarensis TaxID=1470176 RepID=A0A221VYW3_9PSEU|nr:MFS transporter [Actinoalloteichus hoggarensis]ASO18668.1 Antiseptic resistance protein [Actinoalloteichus hoggarensis]MBB5919899.1 DHA2 family multidrug resistance protein-like MFS transporter [Actinoalloteichus hoggarensis]